MVWKLVFEKLKFILRCMWKNKIFKFILKIVKREDFLYWIVKYIVKYSNNNNKKVWYWCKNKEVNGILYIYIYRGILNVIIVVL